MKIPTILEKIIDRKRQLVSEQHATIPLSQLEKKISSVSKPRGFINAIEKTINNNRPAVIAEIKKASPSKGVLRKNFDPVSIAESYKKNGATCLSILTDVDFFQGHNDYLTQVHASCDLPILRKDFMIDPYQIYESRALGADCILLIAACLDDKTMQELAKLATDIGLDVLIEVHNLEELQRSLPLKQKLIGINNRNLHTFETDLNTTYHLLESISDDFIVVTESGIHVQNDVQNMRQHGVNAFLVGEAFMVCADPGAQLKNLFQL